MLGRKLLFMLRYIESFLFRLVVLYDHYFYTPLQTYLSPYVRRIPRSVRVYNQTYHIFTANAVTYSRTLLVVPIVYCLKYDYCFVACLLVLFHDFLDHVDGIVAKVHRAMGYIDDPLLGSFLDAICDKIVNCSLLWSLLMLTDFRTMTYFETVAYIVVCGIIIGYEGALGVVRIQDYYYTKYRDADLNANESNRHLRANMEGKLKEKLESVGLALLCWAHGGTSPLAPIARDVLDQAMPPLRTLSGILGAVSLLLTVRLAHASLTHKLDARKAAANRGDAEDDTDEAAANRVDVIYTVGCFDLFHQGHVNLINRMKKMGRTVVVGVHDDASIIQLKKRAPIEDTATRVANVSRAGADMVYVIPAADPTPFVEAMIADKGLLLSGRKRALYVRGDDMPNFPARQMVEKYMPVKLVPYTAGISTTQLRLSGKWDEEARRTVCPPSTSATTPPVTATSPPPMTAEVN